MHDLQNSCRSKICRLEKFYNYFKDLYLTQIIRLSSDLKRLEFEALETLAKTTIIEL
jgi:hypothetical protein